MDELWQAQLSAAGWNLLRVKRAVTQLLAARARPSNMTQQAGQELGGRPQGRGLEQAQTQRQGQGREQPALEAPVQGQGQAQHQGPWLWRTKLDTDKQQTPHRVRLLVSGGEVAAQAVAQELHALLLTTHATATSAATAGRPAGLGAPCQQGSKLAASGPAGMAAPAPPCGAGGTDAQQQTSGAVWWRCIVHRNAEGAGASHKGWAALDIIPAQAGPGAALEHVARRFGLPQGLVTACVEASGDAEAVANACGRLGGAAVVLGRPQMSAAVAAGSVGRNAAMGQPAAGGSAAAEHGRGKRVAGQGTNSAASRSELFGPMGVLEALDLLHLYEPAEAHGNR